MKLEKIKLRSFRGATKEVTIEFDHSKKITMLFGENGSGKSSIIDGLTAVCDQTFGSLDDRSGARNAKYLISVGHQSKDLLVELYADQKKWAATLTGNKVISAPETPRPPQLRVLRRAQLFKFIEETASERYERLKEFLETPSIDRSEKTLGEAVKNTQRDIDNLISQQVNFENSLHKMWIADGQQLGNATDWASHIIGSDLGHLEAQNAKIASLTAMLAQLNARSLELDGLNADLMDLNAELLALQSHLEDEIKSQVSGAEGLVNVLTAARNYILSEKPSHCPVCDKDFDAIKTAADIDLKIDSFSKLQTALAKTKSKKQSIDGLSAKCEAAYKFADAHISEYKNSADKYKTLQEYYDTEKIGSAHVEYLKIASNENAKKTNAISLISDCYADSIVKLNQKYAENQTKIKSYNAVKLNLTETEICKKEQVSKDQLIKLMKDALAIVTNERKYFIQEILKEISGDIKALYEKIHPDEALSDISLQLDPDRKGSLTWSGHFHSEADVPPQAYYSESHLDTLGICIWLTLTKRFSEKDCIVILDDVLTSVDIVHLDRVIELVDAQSEHFGHIILTTHFGPWRERYRKHSAANANVNFIELKEWSKDWGIIVGNCKPAVAELKHYLIPQNFERQQVASKAGILLEHILDFLALKYSLSVPRKASQDYTLGDLLSAFSANKKKLLRVDHIDDAGGVIVSIPLQAHIDALSGFTWVRNQVGCHASASGELISNKDVRDFGEKVVEFAEAIICPAGGDLPNNNKSGSYWQSQKNRCHLYPLEMP